MLIRGTMTLRNEALIAKREALGLTQREAADLACVPLEHYCRIERLDFSRSTIAQSAVNIAGAFDIPIEQIMPDALAGHQITNKAVQVADVNPARLLTWANPTRFILPSPADEAEQVEVKEALDAAMDKMLTEREKDIVCRRYGLRGHGEESYRGIAKQMNCSTERVRQIERKAIRKLGSPNELSPNPLAAHLRDAE